MKKFMALALAAVVASANISANVEEVLQVPAETKEIVEAIEAFNNLNSDEKAVVVAEINNALTSSKSLTNETKETLKKLLVGTLAAGVLVGGSCLVYKYFTKAPPADKEKGDEVPGAGDEVPEAGDED